MTFHQKKGFTLVETMIASAIGLTMIGLTVMSSVELFKNFSAASGYRDIHQNARKSLALLSKDIRSGVSVSNTDPNILTLSTIGSTGSTNTVQYLLQASTTDPSIQVLKRTETIGGTATTTILTDHATSINFQYWAAPSVTASSAYDTFEVRVFLTVTNTTTFQRMTSDLLQTRALMRNKHY